MKINNIETISPNFGYNPQYHAQFQHSLKNSHSNKEVANCICELDRLAIDTEDKIIALEKHKKLKSEKYSDMTKLLISYIESIAYLSSKYFNSLSYPDSMIAQYETEIVDKKLPDANWRSDACKSLSLYSVRFYNQYNPVVVNTIQQPEAEPEVEAESKQNKTTKKSESLDDIRNQAVDDYINKNGENLVTKYEKNYYSPNGFKDVVGMDELKQDLYDDVIQYILNPDKAIEDLLDYGIDTSRRFLFYGPPGCGKTYFVQALAKEADTDLYRFDVSKIGSYYINKTSQNIEEAFDYIISKAKKSPKPIILFMDEADSIAINRITNLNNSNENKKATDTLLQMLDRIKDESNIVLIAATNMYNNLDEAFVSRFSNQKYIGLADVEQIVDLIKKTYRDRAKAEKFLSDENAILAIAKQLKGYSNRNITDILNEAARLSRRNQSDITAETVLKALKKCDFDKVNESNFTKNSKKEIKRIGFAD